HPLAWMGDLWRRFHELERPAGPSADLAVEAGGELGIGVRREDEVRVPRSGGFERQDDAIAFIRRRLCLPADRDGELPALRGVPGGAAGGTGRALGGGPSRAPDRPDVVGPPRDVTGRPPGPPRTLAGGRRPGRRKTPHSRCLLGK